jgi:hypothetical protein
MTQPRISADDAPGGATALGVLTWGGLSALGLQAHSAIRAVLERHRSAAVDPVWTSRVP